MGARGGGELAASSVPASTEGGYRSGTWRLTERGRGGSSSLREWATQVSHPPRGMPRGRVGRRWGDPEAAFPGSLVLARCYGTTHAVGKAGVWCGVWVGTAAFGQHGTTRTYPTPAVPLPQIRRMAETAGSCAPLAAGPGPCGGLGPDVKGHKHSGICVQIGECCPKASGA